MYDDAAVSRVKDAADIVAVIGRYVPLSRSGSGHRGLCPFHREKTPSFHVSPQRQAFHCFGCGAGGDVFTFLMDFLGVSFREALEELASEYGIDVSDVPRQADPGAPLRRILEEAHSYYVRSLASGGSSGARSYLEKRGISSATSESLGMGWAPQGGGLLRHLSDRGFSFSTAVEAGLAIRPDSGQTYERFRERLLFPIRDRRGRTVSFGGRATGAVEPKYLNGPDTPVYHKGDLLYGFNEARASARDMDTVILVEGYFDHARLYQEGLQCVVATCGTALTQPQARQLVSLAQGVVVCYDGDAAGAKAAFKACEVLLAEGCWPGVVRLDEGTDPDDFVASRGMDAFLSKVETALDPVAFAMSLSGGWRGLEASGRAVQAVKRLLTLASRASGPVLRETMLRRISDMTGYSMETLSAQLEQESPERPARRSVETPRIGASDMSLLRALMSGADGGLDAGLASFLEPGDFGPGPARELFEILAASAAGGGRPASVTGMPPGPASLYTSIAVAQDSKGSLEEQDRARIRERVERRRSSQRLAELRERLGHAGADERKAILKEISGLGSPARDQGGTDA